VVYINKSLTVRGGFTTSNWTTPDPAANLTEWLAAGQGRVAVITGTVDVALEGLRLSYGNAAGLGGHRDVSGAADAGGGLYIARADVTLAQIEVLTSTVSDGNGGGLYQTGGTLTVVNSRLQGGYAYYGGGAYFHDSTVNFANNTVQGNTAIDLLGTGSGLMADGGTVLITGNIIQNNQSDRGVIAADGFEDIDLTITNNQIIGNDGIGIDLAYINAPTIAGNTIQGSEKRGVNLIYTNAILVGNTISGNGGGVYSQGDLQLIGNLIQGNNASQYGGGVNITLAGLESLIADNVIRDNQAGGSLIWGGSGGGIYLDGCNEVPLTGNLLAGNQALNSSNGSQLGRGGGLYLNRSDVIMTNNLLVNNTAQNSGGGMYVTGSSPRLLHTTIANNTGGDGAGILAMAASADPSVLDMKNTIVVSQTIGVKVDSGSAQNLATLDGVLWWANGTNTTGATFVFNATAGNPDFVDPAGGDFHIGLSSAAIDHGINAGVVQDCDAEPRLGTPDLGADEYWAPGALKRVYLPVVLK
jgi:parallel beta-helix repeat protein